jgi:hypothetical protein
MLSNIYPMATTVGGAYFSVSMMLDSVRWLAVANGMLAEVILSETLKYFHSLLAVGDLL